MTLATRKPLKALSGKPKKCAVRACRKPFVPVQPFQSWCSPECGVQIARDKQQKERTALAKIERKAIREAKERVKPRSEYMKEAQAVINRYVRLRDAHLGCVSCERPAAWQGQWHASHYRSRGAAPHLRFNLHNIHKSCSICNNHLSGNIMGYRPELVRRIGEERVALLEASQGRAGFTTDYLKRLKRVFAEKTRRLEARRAEE